jgi:hypothetical protein
VFYNTTAYQAPATYFNVLAQAILELEAGKPVEVDLGNHPMPLTKN